MSTIIITDYLPEHQQAFEALNKAWLLKYFHIEPVDEYVLANPREAILDKGGAILVALVDETVAGVVALKKLSDSEYEFTKMAVEDKFQRRGIAEKLSHACFETLRQPGGNKIILYSHTSLVPAITLYRKLGFKTVPLDTGNEYKRSDIKMEMFV